MRFRVAYLDPPYVVYDFPPAPETQPAHPSGLPPNAILPGADDLRPCPWSRKWVEVSSDEQPTSRGHFLHANHDFVTLRTDASDSVTLIRTASTVIRVKPFDFQVPK